MLIAMVAHPISLIVDDSVVSDVPISALEAQAKRVLAAEDATEGELSIVVTDDETVRDLNRRFRGIDKPTDVLSFGQDVGKEFATPPGEAASLGEVIIAHPTACRQAEGAGVEVEFELRHLLTHGILHLLGYGHEAEAEAKLMRAHEEAVLDGWRH